MDPFKRTFKVSDIAALTGVPRRTVILWTDLGYLRADLSDPGGTGHHRLYSWQAAVECALIEQMRLLGVGPKLFGKNVIARKRESPRNEKWIAMLRAKPNERLKSDLCLYYYQYGKRRKQIAYNVATYGEIKDDLDSRLLRGTCFVIVNMDNLKRRLLGKER